MNRNEINITNKVRVYVSQVMKKAYTSADLSERDKKSLSSLAIGLDLFLKNIENKEFASDLLKDAMIEMVNDTMISEEWIGRKMTDTKEHFSLNQKKILTESGKYIYLSELVGTGGEGSVYKINGIPGKVVKIYNSHVDLDEKERRIGVLIKNMVPKQIDNTIIATIPEERIYLENGKFVGYIMPYISSQFKIYDIMRSSQERTKYFPELDYRGLIVIAYNLAEVVHVLHEHDVVIGDMNIANIIVNIDGTVCLIDVDSFDIRDKETGEHFSCRVGMSEMLAPELQVCKTLDGHFTKETDYFSLAIIIFRLLMSNADPFCGVSPVGFSSSLIVNINENIINGNCPYVRNCSFSIPKWAPDFQMLPKKIRVLFDRAFNYSKENYLDAIVNRPDALEWMKALMEYYQSPMNQCKDNVFHWYLKDLKQCPFCKKTDEINNDFVLSVGIS